MHALSPRRAFTLVELLVVITVVAGLISLLLPALNKSRTRARFLICQARLHSLGIGTLAYTNDNKSAYPYRQCTRLGGSQTTILCETTLFSATAYDDRPMYNRFLNIDQDLVCPFSPLPKGESLKAGTNLQVWASYEVWAGSSFSVTDPATRMARVGDRPRLTISGTTYQFNLLADDFERDWNGQGGAYNLAGSHDDENSNIPYAINFDHAIYAVAHHVRVFGSAAAMGRGTLERNFLTDDGSVRARRFAFRDPATVRVQFQGNTINPFVYGWLPPME